MVTYIDSAEAQLWVSASNTYVTVPGTVQTGDRWIMVAGRDEGNPVGGTPPAGSTTILSELVAGNSCWSIYSGTHNGETTLNLTGMSTSATLVVVWYRDAALGAIGTPWVRSSSAATLTCPSITRLNAGSTILCLGGDRSTASTAGETGYASVSGATFRTALQGNPTLGSAAQICASWWSEKSGTDPTGDVTWTLNDSSGNGFGIQVELVGSTIPVSNNSNATITVWDGTTELDTTLTVWNGTTEDPVTSVTVMKRGYSSVYDMTNHVPFWVAHRGGSLNWPELSLRAYTQSVANSIGALEVSVSRSSDGVWFGLHDQTLLRTSGVDINPTILTWSQIQGYTITPPSGTSQTNANYMRLEELLEVYGSTHVIFLDPKYLYGDPAYRTELLDLALQYVPVNHLVGKYFYTGTYWGQECQARGIETWGYFYEADVPNYSTYGSAWSMLGLNYDASQSAWDTMLATGKKVIGFVCPDIDAANIAIGKGAHGAVVQDVLTISGGSEVVVGTNQLGISPLGLAPLGG